jgi:adenine-specific DNA-methyltransferase
VARQKTSRTESNKPIEQYTHGDKDRVNIPPVGLVTPDTDKEAGKQKYDYDPHLDPQLQWAGKTERTSFEVPTVSLHVHERIDPRTIIEAVRKKEDHLQPSLFKQSELPLRQAIEFYKHRQNWTNRLIAGDSMLVMNSLLVKEGLAAQVQSIYFDPPYGIKYGSNFQPFVNKRDVKDGKDEDLTNEPETLKAFRDTWELNIHSYLTYLRDRLLLARELLSETGSIFVQISDENVHLVRNLMDEVFHTKNFISLISYVTSGSFTSELLSRAGDYIIWYAKDKKSIKYRELFKIKTSAIGEQDSKYDQVELSDGTRRALTWDEKRGLIPLPKNSRIFRVDTLVSQGYRKNTTVDYEFDGQTYHPGAQNNWKASVPEGMDRLKKHHRILASAGGKLGYIRYFDDFPAQRLTNLWNDIGGGVQSRSDPKVYVVQTGTSVVERCLLMTTDPGDLVLDSTCGSGTTAFIAEQWGRRWITCDTSRVSITLAKQRLMTANFDYYELAKPSEGVSSGFRYKMIPHVTLKSIANNEPPKQETLYDNPFVDSSKLRVTGPFTVEAVPAPTVQAMHEVEAESAKADSSIARRGETVRQSELRDELLKTGIRGRQGEKLMFSRVEPMSGTRFLHADAEVLRENGNEASRAVISFSPEHHPLGQVQVARALEEANRLFPKPKFVIFAAFQFDPEAAQDIEETVWSGVTLLKAKMNDDLHTADLKKRRSSNESFWLIGQPDVQLHEARTNEKGEKLYQVELLGFDYFDTKEGKITSGSADRIALWMLDTDYDGRSIFPHQVFFPMAGEKEGWSRLAKNLRAQIDEELIKAYRGKVSLPFAAGTNRRVAIKIVDDRGIESIKLVDLP